MPQNAKPPWGRLYVLALLWLVLLVLVFRLPVALGWQQVIGCGVLVGFLVVLLRWLYINRAALVHEDRERDLRSDASMQRDLPLRPVQAHYLRAMEHYARKHI